ncbi:MAG: phosphoribosyl-AMP cyclohydrolase, partial [Microbacteriaceae bacterium]|nr:phosphoribosyl-AMP cyclohydrolase [Microbacteriaceae bacterium]
MRNVEVPKLVFDDNGLIPCIVQNDDSGKVLMLGYMNLQAYQQTIETRSVTFYSRSREQLWVKGETSGNILKLVSIAMDCDSDALLAKVIPEGPTCHTGSESCFETDE